MNALLAALALFLFQMNTSQPKPVVHLLPNRAAITADFGGKLLQLLNAPGILALPATPPPLSPTGVDWLVDVKNLGPAKVKINGKGNFTVTLFPGETVHISSDGTRYSLVH